MDCFLAPWLAVLLPHLRIRTTRHSAIHTHTTHGHATIVPQMDHIAMLFTETLARSIQHDRPAQVRLRHAMELLGLALQVDPTTVWSLLQSRSGHGIQYTTCDGCSPYPQPHASDDALDPRAFRDADRSTTLVIEFDHLTDAAADAKQEAAVRHDRTLYYATCAANAQRRHASYAFTPQWFACCRDVFTKRDDDNEGEEDEMYVAAKQQLLEQASGTHSNGWIPLRVHVLPRAHSYQMVEYADNPSRRWKSPEMEALADMLEAIVSPTDAAVCTTPPLVHRYTADHPHTSLFCITGVELQLLLVGEQAVAPLTRIRSLGIHIQSLTSLTSYQRGFDDVLHAVLSKEDTSSSSSITTATTAATATALAPPTSNITLWTGPANDGDEPDSLLAVYSVLRLQAEPLDELSVFVPDASRHSFAPLGVLISQRKPQSRVKRLRLTCGSLTLEAIRSDLEDVDIAIQRGFLTGYVAIPDLDPTDSSIIEHSRDEGDRRDDEDDDEEDDNEEGDDQLDVHAVRRALEAEGVVFTNGRTPCFPLVRAGWRPVDVLTLPSGRLLQVPSQLVTVESAQTTEAAVTHLAAGQSDGSPRLDAFHLVTFSFDQDDVVPLLGLLADRVLSPSHLRELDLDLSPIAPFTSDSIDVLLRSFPHLESLRLAHTQLTTMDVFLDAYQDGRCSRLRVLSLDAGGPGFIPFFEALADPHSTVSRTLTEFRVHIVADNYDVLQDHGHEASDVGGAAYLDAIAKALRHNHVLQYLDVVVRAAATDHAFVQRVASVLRPFHRMPLPVRRLCASKLPLRCKLALLSVVSYAVAINSATRTSTEPAGRLDSFVVSRILEFASPSEIRIIHLCHEMSRKIEECTRAMAASYFNETDQRAVSL